MVPTPPDDLRKILRAGFAEFLTAIQHCVQQDLTTPAVILIYSLVDIAGWLDGKGPRATAKSFKDWANRYLLSGNPPLECNADDLWNARCGVVHTMSPYSDRDRLRRIYYTTGDTSPQLLREMGEVWASVLAALHARGVHLPPPEDNHTVVRLEDLAAAARNATNQFLSEVETDPERQHRMQAKAVRVFMKMEDQDLAERIAWGRNALQDHGTGA